MTRAWNDAGALVSPNGMTRYSKYLRWVLKSIFHSPSLSWLEVMSSVNQVWVTTRTHGVHQRPKTTAAGATCFYQWSCLALESQYRDWEACLSSLYGSQHWVGSGRTNYPSSQGVCNATFHNLPLWLFFICWLASSWTPFPWSGSNARWESPTRLLLAVVWFAIFMHVVIHSNAHGH